MVSLGGIIPENKFGSLLLFFHYHFSEGRFSSPVGLLSNFNCPCVVERILIILGRGRWAPLDGGVLHAITPIGVHGSIREPK